MSTHNPNLSRPCNPSCKPRWVNGKGSFDGWQLKFCYTHQIIHDTRLMRLCQYLKVHPDSYQYTGSIWGQMDTSSPCFGPEWAAMIAQMGYDAPLIQDTGNGYYLQAGSVFYRDNRIDELVLLRVNR